MKKERHEQHNDVKSLKKIARITGIEDRPRIQLIGRSYHSTKAPVCRPQPPPRTGGPTSDGSHFRVYVLEILGTRTFGSLTKVSHSERIGHRS